MALTLDDIRHLLLDLGGSRYGGEAVSQREHALQCAALAARAGEDEALVAACLLHDLGHLVAPGAGAGGEHGRDDLHQYLALPVLRGLFPDGVLEPIRLHVDAKRYLCHVEPAYHDGLSPASRHSLRLQGGVFDAAQAAAFVAQPHGPAAVRLRVYDDQAKVAGLVVPPLADYLPLLERLVLAARAPA